MLDKVLLCVYPFLWHSFQICTDEGRSLGYISLSGATTRQVPCSGDAANIQCVLISTL